MAAHATSVQRWFIMYGNSLSAQQLAGVQLAIVEPGHISPKSQFPGVATKFYGYISVGEVNESRPYWSSMSQAAWVLAANPNWPGAHGVDIRALAWQKLLRGTVVPELARNGFNGVFLDTLDEALRLEDENPKRFRGTRKTLVQFIRSLKADFPNLGILPNNGLAILQDIGDVIDGVVIEDFYTRYNFEKKVAEAAPTADDQEKEIVLDAFVKKFRKPVFVVLYGDPQSDLVKSSIARCKTKGYHWYVANIDLMTIGTME